MAILSVAIGAKGLGRSEELPEACGRSQEQIADGQLLQFVDAK